MLLLGAKALFRVKLLEDLQALRSVGVEKCLAKEFLQLVVLKRLKRAGIF